MFVETWRDGIGRECWKWCKGGSGDGGGGGGSD